MSAGVRGALRRLSGESLVYGLGQVSGRAVNLLLVPVLTRALLRQQYGVADLVLSYSASVLLVLVFGMDAALARFFYEQPDRAARVRMVSSSLLFRLATGGAVAAVAAACAGPLAVHALGGGVYAKYLRIGALTLPCTLLVLFCNDVLRVTFQPWKFIALNVAQTLLVGGLTIGFVVGRHLGVAGALYGKLAGDGLAALLGLALCRHNLRPRFGAAVLRTMLGYGVPLVPVACAYGVIGAVDRWTLQRFATLDDVGTYGLAMKFFAVVTMGVSAFQLAFMPFAFARAREPDAPRLFARVLGLYVALASGGALLVGLLAPALVTLLAPRAYAGAAAPALWLGFAAVAQGAYYVAALGVNLARRNALLGWSAGGAALVAAGANRLLVPRWGAGGAAVATFLGYATSAVLAYAIAQRVRPLPFRGARLAALFAAALGLGVAAARLAPAGAAGVAVKAAAVAGFALLAWTSDVWRDRGAVRHRAAGT
ncbi:MAG TPA: lipopolysaccharide biosynthesis protein [Candidatus Eisenbacteria bacterium]|nr:lipopolysaccharide biosynthesis protein [Candidatus Eisenbacteria bacterium]